MPVIVSDIPQAKTASRYPLAESAFLVSLPRYDDSFPPLSQVESSCFWVGRSSQVARRYSVVAYRRGLVGPIGLRIEHHDMNIIW